MTATSTTKKKSKRSKKVQPKVVEGVTLTRVNEKVLREAFTTAAKEAESRGLDGKMTPKVAEAETATIPVLVRKLATFYRGATDIVGCTECGGDSDGNLDVCPFCGEEGVVEEGGNIDVTKDEPEGAEEPEQEPEVIEPQEQGGDPPAVELVQVKGKGKKSAITKGRSGNAGLLTETDLDAAVTRVQRLHEDTTRGAWELAHAIKKILDFDLWKLRKNQGKVLHRTFKQFVESELKITYMQAFRLAKVADAYPKELVDKIGTTKLYLLLQAPPEKREELLDEAEKGASAAELSAAVKESTDYERNKPAAKTALTVAMAPGIATLQLQKRPKKDHPSLKSTEPADSVSDNPWGMELLANGVIIVYHVIQHPKTGKLLLRIERRRAKKGESFPDEA